jgi:hypothetical protein
MSDMTDRRALSHCGPVEYAPKEQVSAERSEAESLLRSIPGVKGVGEGRDQIGDPAWIAYVQDASVSARLPTRIGNRSVISEVSGEIDILPA